jgi:hypothetical protein
VRCPVNRFLAIVGVMWSAALLPASPVPKDSPEKLARATVERLIAGLKKCDPDAVMQVLEVPYSFGKEKFTDRVGLENRIRHLLKNAVNIESLSTKVGRVLTRERFEKENLIAKVRTQPSDSEIKILMEQIGPEGRIVLLHASKEHSEDEHPSFVFVRVKDGVAKVVGSID